MQWHGNTTEALRRAPLGVGYRPSFSPHPLPRTPRTLDGPDGSHGQRQRLVVGGRGLQLLGGVQVLDVHQTTAGQLPEARHALVRGVVVLEVFALQIFAPLAPVVHPERRRP